MNKFPETSVSASAEDPSKEFCWTWFCITTNVYGMWYRTEKEAIDAANFEFHSFSSPAMDHYKVIIIKATTGYNIHE